jgi:hypothetical protein
LHSGGHVKRWILSRICRMANCPPRRESPKCLEKEYKG